MTDRVPASVRYKEITDLATAAGQLMRKWEKERAAELEKTVSANQERIDTTEAQRDQVLDDVRKRWNAAMEALWHERWLKVMAMPDPDLSAPPASPEESRRCVQNAFLDLHNALAKPRLWKRARSSDQVE